MNDDDVAPSVRSGLHIAPPPPHFFPRYLKMEFLGGNSRTVMYWPYEQFNGVRFPANGFSLMRVGRQFERTRIWTRARSSVKRLLAAPCLSVRMKQFGFR